MCGCVPGHQFVRRGRDDGEALEPPVDGLGRLLRFFRRVPQAGKGHHLSVAQVEAKGLLVLRVDLLPLVEAARRHQAATLLEGFTRGT